MKLTKTAIDRATYQGEQYQGSDGHPKWRRYVLWDSDVPGLGLRITPAGKKAFVLSYRAGARKRLITLGAYGVLTLTQARKMARRKLAAVLDGEDPMSARQEAREGLTVADLAKRYLAEHAEPKKKPSSAKEDRRILDKHILPALGSRAVADLDRQDAARLHHAMRATPIAANRTLALLSTMCTLAERWGMRPDGSNPTRHVSRFREKARERFLTAGELERLGDVLADAEREQQVPPEAIAAVRLLLLTGCRRGEILALRWEHVDFDRGALRLPDSKTGRKAVPLGAPALALLDALPRTLGNPYVLPGRGGKGHLVGITKIWQRLRARAGLDDVRLHDLRHSFAAAGAGGGLGLPMIGRLLGHRVPTTTARYAHLADDPLKRAADQISGEIAGALAGKRGAVAPHRRRG